MPWPAKALPASAIGRQHWLCLALIFAGHTCITLYWLRLDQQPPLWDMALHQSVGLRFHDYYLPQGNQEATSWWDISGAYPPFYHHLPALAFVFGRDGDMAVMANIPITALLLLGTFLLGCRWFSASAGLWAALLLACFPYMAWISRETVIDYTLTAVVLWCILALECTQAFSRRVDSLILGGLLALCALTKWIGPLFLILPMLYFYLKGWSPPEKQVRAEVSGDSSRKFIPPLTQRGRNFWDAILIAGALTLLWYGPKLPEIIQFLRRNTLVGAAEGEPPVFSWQSTVYYLRLLEGQQLHLFFSLAVLAGLFYAFRKQRTAFNVLVCWILSGYIGLTLLRTKDPRFSLPYLPAMALLSACWIDGLSIRWIGPAARILMAGMAIGTFWLVSFGWGQLPREVVLCKGYQGSYSWDWRLYSQDYFGLLGPPRSAIWPQEKILWRIVQEGTKKENWKLGIVPDFPRFNHENLRLAARLRRWPVDVYRIGGSEDNSESFLSQMDFIIVAEGQQGMEWSTRHSKDVNQFVGNHPEQFTVDLSCRLPDGNHLRLYRVKR